MQADLELAFWGRDANHFAAELRYSSPRSDADIRKSGQDAISISWEKFRELQADPEAYGALLTETVFADQRLRTAFAQALADNEHAKGESSRFKLSFGPSATRLHDLLWETLRHPETGAPLAISERIPFSRFLESSDWQPVQIVSKGDLHAVVVIASPLDVDTFTPGGRQLPPIDVAGEEARAREYLFGMPIKVLASGGSATLDNIIAELSEGHAVLYLICHGAMRDGQSYVWLEDDTGKAAPLPGTELVTRLKGLQELPRLVVLASCQSAGTGADSHSSDGGCLAALGPQMAAAGVPAVVAMQGDVSMSTVSQFMPRLFSELLADGRIDHAVAVARAGVLNRQDWWAPVLFTRLRSGRLWYEPGFTEAGDEVRRRWPAILHYIEQGKLTPILGSGLVDSYLGSRRQVAEHWAEQYGFPMAPHWREDLPHVAQFLAVQLALSFPRDELNAYMKRELRRRYAHELRDLPKEAPLDELIREVGAVKRERDPCEPHRVLAELPLPVYITTNYSSLLNDALIEAGKKPVWDYFRWRHDLVEHPSAYSRRLAQGAYEPTPQEPLVYHLFGHFSEPDSVVLTEDDYFRYMMGAIEHRRHVPEPVLRALADTALLFLGYQLDDWNFRALFWTLIAPQGGRRDQYAHFAAQVDPEEGRIIDSARARRYLEDYFRQQDIALRIGIFWGTAQRFACELHQQWSARPDQ